MQKPNGMSAPLIIAKKTMPIDPFHVDGLGWLKIEETITAQQVLAIMNLIVSLLLPRPANVIFDMKAYSDKYNLSKYFTEEKPESLKQTDQDHKVILDDNQKTQH